MTEIRWSSWHDRAEFGSMEGETLLEITGCETGSDEVVIGESNGYYGEGVDILRRERAMEVGS